MKFIRYKIALVFLLALLVGSLCNRFGFSVDSSFLIGWLTFGSVYLILSLITLLKVESTQITSHAAEEDLGVRLQFVLLLITCFTAFVTIIFWKTNTTGMGKHYHLDEVIFILSITISWLVVHVSFLFRYAHMYYGDHNKRYQKHIRGLDFPDDSQPDYLDFAYYSFTIGMTFQVSDVVIKSKGMRRLTLLHSLISFLFNTILIAITINEIVNL
jgi:uncharacterized membrane protein